MCRLDFYDQVPNPKNSNIMCELTIKPRKPRYWGLVWLFKWLHDVPLWPTEVKFTSRCRIGSETISVSINIDGRNRKERRETESSGDGCYSLLLPGRSLIVEASSRKRIWKIYFIESKKYTWGNLRNTVCQEEEETTRRACWREGGAAAWLKTGWTWHRPATLLGRRCFASNGRRQRATSGPTSLLSRPSSLFHTTSRREEPTERRPDLLCHFLTVLHAVKWYLGWKIWAWWGWAVLGGEGFLRWWLWLVLGGQVGHCRW